MSQDPQHSSTVPCPACGAPADRESILCRSCGAATNPHTCPDCGFDNVVPVNFCGGCGRQFVDSAPPSPRLAESIAAMTPQHLAEQIMAARSELKGAKRLATVLFADTLGSMAILKDLDSEGVGSILDPIVEIMVEGVHRYEGTVNQIMGDGIMALFGVPIAHEDHAVRAAHAAIAIHEAFDQARSEGRFEKGREPYIRIGLNSGEVRVTAIRNDLSIDLRAVGETTNMASRMENFAKPGTTCLTAQTVRLAGGLIDVRSLGRKPIKGIAEPIEIFELLGTNSKSRFRAHMTRGSPWFVGRRDGLDMLRRSREAVIGGEMRTVLVEGEAGIGKSRLCDEFLARVPGGEMRMLEANAVAFRRSDYGVLRQLTRSFLDTSPEDSAKVISERLDERLAELGIVDQCRLGLANILGLGAESPEWAELDAIQRRFRQFEALRILIETLSERSPLLVFCEDLHWIDTESLAFIQSLVLIPPERRIMLLLTHRPDFERDWSAVANVRTCRLNPLTFGNRRTLIAKLVGESDELRDLRDELAVKTDGNPFFIEESIQALRDEEVLVGRVGKFKLRPGDLEIKLPDSIKTVVEARLGNLSDALRDVVEAAAVLGGDMSVEEIMAVLELSVSDFRPRLDSLLGLNLLVRFNSEQPSMIRFKHATVQDVAYRNLLRADKQALHGKAMRALESIYADRVIEQVDRLADHSFRAELWESAVSYNLDACRRAAERSAHHEAAQALDRGLRALVHLPSDEEWVRAGIDIGLRAMEALLPLGDKEKLVSVLHDAETRARSIGDEPRLGAALTQLATARWINAEHTLSEQSADAALELGMKHNSIGLIKAAWHSKASVHHAHAEFDEVIRIQRGLLEDYEGELAYKRFGWPGYPSVFCRTFLGSALTFIGDFEEAVIVFEKGLEISDAVDHPYSQAICREEYGYALLWLDRVDDALRVLTEAQDICRDYDVYTMYPAICGRLALALSMVGRAEEAIEIAEPAYMPEIYERAGRYALNFLLTGLGSAYLASERIKDALGCAERVQGLTALANEHAHHACALALRGDVELARNDLAQAERAYRDGMKIAVETGMRPVEAQCRQGTGEACLRAQRGSHARKELETAAKIFDDIGLVTRADAARVLLDSI